MPKAGTVHSIAEGVEGLRDRHRAGRACALDEGQQATLKALVLQGPKLERDGCVAWRLHDLCRLVERRFGVRYSETGMLRLLKSLELSWQKARPVHPEADRQAQERFKKACQPCSGTWRPVTRRRSGSSYGSPTRPE
jgi:transposase